MQNHCETCLYKGDKECKDGWVWCTKDDAHAFTTMELACYTKNAIDLTNPICSHCIQDVTDPKDAVVIVQGDGVSIFFCSLQCAHDWAAVQIESEGGPVEDIFR